MVNLSKHIESQFFVKLLDSLKAKTALMQAEEYSDVSTQPLPVNKVGSPSHKTLDLPYQLIISGFPSCPV